MIIKLITGPTAFNLSMLRPRRIAELALLFALETVYRSWQQDTTWELPVNHCSVVKIISPCKGLALLQNACNNDCYNFSGFKNSCRYTVVPHIVVVNQHGVAKNVHRQKSQSWEMSEWWSEIYAAFGTTMFTHQYSIKLNQTIRMITINNFEPESSISCSISHPIESGTMTTAQAFSTMEYKSWSTR